MKAATSPGWISPVLALVAILGSGIALMASTSLTGLDSRSAEIVLANNRGVALLDQYKFKEAIQEFQKALALDDSILPLRVNLGIANFYDQKYEAAIEAFQKVLEVDPKQIHSLYVLGLIYRNQDEVDKAIQAFSDVHNQDPRDPSTNYYLGRMYMRERDFAEAERYFKLVIAEEPYNASAHYNLSTALSRSGKKEEGTREMNEFRRLQDLFGSTTVGLQYLEQGRYAIAIDTIPDRYLTRTAGPVEAAVPVKFSEVAKAAGLEFTHAGPGRLFNRVASAKELEESVAPSMGSGIAFADYDRDGWLDLYIANAGSSSARGSLYRNRGDGTFELKTDAAGISYSGNTMQAVWGDFDNDLYPDLYLINYGPNVLYRNRKDGTFEDVTAATGTGDASWGIGGGFLDYDHDGDLDLMVVNLAGPSVGIAQPIDFPAGLKTAANVLYRNNGNGTFTDVVGAAKLGGSGKELSFLSADLNNTRDVDFLLVNWEAPAQLLDNLRDGTFAAVKSETLASVGAWVGATAGDYDSDGLPDLGMASMDPGGSRLLHNLGHDRYEVDPQLSSLIREPVLNFQFLDFDNDGDLDLLALCSSLFGSGAPSPQARNLYLLENTEGKFTDASAKVGLDRVRGKAIRGVGVADYDADGDLDFALNINGGSPLLFRNDGGNKNNWLALRLVGTNSNKSGLGVKAEIKAGRLWQRQEVAAGQGYLGQTAPLLHFGLGKRSQADVVRLIWPNGVIQSEIDRPANQVIEIQELDRKGTSCPILYVWDGKEYRFQTDFLGGSAYGMLLAPGAYEKPDTDEYVKLRREDVALKNGRVAVTLNNQLEEVILFDRLELVAVDHPESYDVYPDEKLLPGPPYDPFRVLTAEGARPPVAASDGKGHSVLSALERVDRIYAEAPKSLPFKGYSDLHELILDLGPVSDQYAVLLMTAWIDYADSTSNLAAWQAGVKLIPPSLQVQDEKGEWVTAIKDMGFPAGLPKMMTVDLSGKFRSASRKIRIVTNMRIFWDQVLVAGGRLRDDFRLHRLDAERAELQYRGFPKFASFDGRQPNTYDYAQDMPAEWKVHVGAYTRFGDVLPLLAKIDDMFVITRSGDEIEAQFDVRRLPPLPDGWVRDYLVFVDGFGKDMDPNSATPNFLGPLPSHAMTAYPYPPGEGYPDDPAHLDYLRKWNTRIYENAVPDLPLVADED